MQPTEMHFFINVNCRIKRARDLEMGLTVLLKVFYHINGDKEDFLRKCSSKPKNHSFGNPPLNRGIRYRIILAKKSSKLLKKEYLHRI